MEEIQLFTFHILYYLYEINKKNAHIQTRIINARCERCFVGAICSHVQLTVSNSKKKKNHKNPTRKIRIFHFPYGERDKSPSHRRNKSAAFPYAEFSRKFFHRPVANLSCQYGVDNERIETGLTKGKEKPPALA